MSLRQDGFVEEVHPTGSVLAVVALKGFITSRDPLGEVIFEKPK